MHDRSAKVRKEAAEVLTRLGIEVESLMLVDLSRNGSRRFCSTACQNRTKAAALRMRRRTGAIPVS